MDNTPHMAFVTEPPREDSVEEEIKTMETQLKGLRGEVKALLGVFNRGDVRCDGLVGLPVLMECVQQVNPSTTFDSIKTVLDKYGLLHQSVY